MNTRFACLDLAAATALVLASAQAARAQPVLWPADVAVTTAPGQQGMPVGSWPGVEMQPDGAGGAFVAWADWFTGHVRVQRLDATGRALWGAGGVAVAPGTWSEMDPRIVADGQGGVIAAWVDGRLFNCDPGFLAECDVFAQRLDARGRPLWGEFGTPVVQAARNQGTEGIGLAADGTGGAIVAWGDARPPHCCQMYAQRIRSDGSAAWTLDGIPVSPPPTFVVGAMGRIDAASDGAGGAFLVWYDPQVKPGQLTVQRLDGAGNLLFPGTGVRIVSMLSRYDVEAGEGGSLLLAWTGPGRDPWEVWAQKVAPSGQRLWGDAGAAVAAPPDYQTDAQIVGDGSGGAYVSWDDGRAEPLGNACAAVGANCDVYAQRIVGGLPAWAADGVPVSTSPGEQASTRLVSHGDSGVTVVWQDCRDHAGLNACIAGSDLYAQRLTGQGAPLGPANGTVVSAAAANQGTANGSSAVSFSAVGNGADGAIVGWPDGRNGLCAEATAGSRCDVYAQRVSVAPGPAVVFAGDADGAEAGGPLTVHVTLSHPVAAPVVVTYASQDGTAEAGVDYAAVAGTLTLPPGAVDATIAVPLLDDDIDEPAETFTVRLLGAVGATIGRADGPVTIDDDEAPPGVIAEDCDVIEGDFVPVPCSFAVRLTRPSAFPVTVAYSTGPGSATISVDYLPAASGFVFDPGVTTRFADVTVLPDTLPEVEEDFVLQAIGVDNTDHSVSIARGTIVDDDGSSPQAARELAHGSLHRGDLRADPGPAAHVDRFRLALSPRASYEVVVDGTSGDLGTPLLLERVGADGSTVVQSGAAVGTGSAARLAWQHTPSNPSLNQHLRVRSAGCGTDCGADDVYRLRFYETTASISRWNAAGSQTTVLVLQNTRAEAVQATAYFWAGDGALLSATNLALAPHGSFVLNTAALTALRGRSGSITLSHTGGYGGVTGKAVSLELASGSSFDTPLVYRPR